MLSALMMLRRVMPALRYAFSEEEFGPIFGAGVVLVCVSTLTATSVSDPDLVLQDGWLKVFTVLYQLIGIGILVEILRRLGIAFITVRAREKSDRPGGARGSA
jgi:hypothetical protein